MGICSVWSESSLCAQWVAKDPILLPADREASDQTGRMPSLIWVFAGRTCLFVGFVMRHFKCLKHIVIWIKKNSRLKTKTSMGMQTTCRHRAITQASLRHRYWHILMCQLCTVMCHFHIGRPISAPISAMAGLLGVTSNSNMMLTFSHWTCWKRHHVQICDKSRYQRSACKRARLMTSHVSLYFCRRPLQNSPWKIMIFIWAKTIAK